MWGTRLQLRTCQALRRLLRTITHGLQEYHLRDPPIRLFSVMRRSVTTAPVVATFLGDWGLSFRTDRGLPRGGEPGLVTDVCRGPGSAWAVHRGVRRHERCWTARGAAARRHKCSAAHKV